MKEQFESQLPPETRAIMHKATDELAESGIMERVLKRGAKMPRFTLPDAHGNEVSSETLIEEGPLVVSFYRGVW